MKIHRALPPYTEKTGIITSLSAQNTTPSTALRRFGIFTLFLTIFIYTLIPLVTCKRMILSDLNINKFEMREFQDIGVSHSSYKTINYHYKSIFYIIMRAGTTLELSKSIMV